MEFSALLKKRRAIRDYEDKDVPMELVEEIIAESLYAPSGGNRQPWGFIIVNDRSTIQRLSDSSKQTLLDAIQRDPNHPMKVYKEGLSSEKPVSRSFCKSVLVKSKYVLPVVAPWFDSPLLRRRGALY